MVKTSTARPASDHHVHGSDGNGNGIAGAGVDAQGLAVRDPTKNVLDLVWAESKYQDGMREALLELLETKISALQHNITVAEQHHREMDAAESRRVNEQLSLRAAYEERLTQAEAKRIDAIRAVDVNAVSVANQRATEQAAVLATQVAQSAEQLRTQVASSAEALRSLVATTASTAATTLQQIVNPLTERISKLEQAGYTDVGKRSLADPAMVALLAEVKALSSSGTAEGGRKEGSASTWALVGAIIVGAGGIIGTLAMFLGGGGG